MIKLKNIFKNSVLIISILFMIDYFTKLLILKSTGYPVNFYGNYQELFPPYFLINKVSSFFDIILVWNNGISFSMFSSSSDLNRWILITVSLIVIGYVIYLLTIEKDRYLRIAFCLIIAGALGNIFDRIRYGAVIDFLDFYIGNYHWPAFNAADSFICLGVITIITRSILTKKQP